MDQNAFDSRLASELRRLGITDHEARFLGFDGFDATLFDQLAKLPDGAGAAAFYTYLGADFNRLQREEKEWLERPRTDD